MRRISYQTALRWYHRGLMPVPVCRVGRLVLVDCDKHGLPSEESTSEPTKVIIYARVSSADQKPDLDRQIARVMTWASAKELSVAVYEKKRIPETHRNPGSVVGIDMGVGDHVIVAANPHGDEVMRRGLPTTISDHEKKIRHLQHKMSRKRGSDKRTKTTPSNRWVRANNQIRKYHNTMANVRHDFTAKAAHELAENYATVVIEDLNVRSMMTRGGVYKRGLNRAIAQASFANLRRRITYKTRWSSGTTIVADRWFPSSKTCSRCGEVKSKLSLSEREYICHRCGVVVDRDLNAATNLAKLAVPKSGVSNIDRTGSSPGIGRGGAGKTSSLSGGLALAGEASMARKGLSGRKAGTR